MNLGFWGKLKKPIMALAPMADVTDAAFRRIIARCGKPNVMWTEFVSADGLIRADKVGQEKLMKGLLYSESERPIVAQFFSAKPEMIKRAAKLAQELRFDGVDINMGCPDRSVEKQGAGAALMKNPKLARELIVATREGAPRLPISVKTRIGYNKNEIETWIPELLKEDLAAITVHLRTRKEMSKVPARWDLARRVVEIRDEAKSTTLVLGNGDVQDMSHARKLAHETGVDGIMLGRAIFGNPFLFSNSPRIVSRLRRELWGKQEFENKNGDDFVRKKLEIMLEHTKLFEELLGGDNPIRTRGRETCPISNGVKNFSVMKKHYKAYANGFDGAKELRTKLMETKNAKEVENIVNDFLETI